MKDGPCVGILDREGLADGCCVGEFELEGLVLGLVDGCFVVPDGIELGMHG